MLLSRTPSNATAAARSKTPTHDELLQRELVPLLHEEGIGPRIDTPVRFQALRLLYAASDGMGVTWVVAHLVSLRTATVAGTIEV